MASAVRTLGFGSSGSLSFDTIDKLKKNDKKYTVDRIEGKITENLTKQKDLTAIKTLLTTFKGSVNSLTDDSTYLKRSVNTDGKSAELSVKSGVKLQNFDIEVNQLAQKDSYQSKGFKYENNAIMADVEGFKSTTFNINIGNQDEKNSFEIKVEANTSIEDIAKQINEKAGNKLEAKVLNTGDGDNSFKLIIQSKNTGSNNKISFEAVASEDGDKSVSNSALQALGLDSDENGELINQANHLKKAQDAKFVFDGIQITRDSNEISDLVFGATIKLKTTDKDGSKTSFKVDQDTSDIQGEIENFIKQYNQLMNNLAVATDYNAETKTVGVLQGLSEVTKIRSEINKIVVGVSKDGKSLQDFGLSITKDGILKLDSTQLKDKLENNFDDFKAFFSNKTTYESASFRGTKMPESSEAIELQDGDIKINGKSLKLNLEANATEKQKANALLEAINKLDIKGLKARIGLENELILQTEEINSISITGNEQILSKFGLEKKEVNAKTNNEFGFFQGLKDKLEGLIGQNGSVVNLENRLSDEKKKMVIEKDKAQKILDEKYDMMEKKFAAYDGMMAKLNSQFSTLQSMIDAELNRKK